ncbi:hypothetical protein [Burkholderia vietnamiensis]|uniref:hypothetical protein n=1 Tax=Burkholderia vietnamiensis TaxID=60552 RepID=UPI001CC44608|nr:hypothetical protein [Burkholderia vietnamiensis]
MSRDDDRGIRRDRPGRRDAHGSRRWRGVGLHDGGVLACGLRRETRERFMHGDQRADDAERADAPARGVQRPPIARASGRTNDGPIGGGSDRRRFNGQRLPAACAMRRVEVDA